MAEARHRERGDQPLVRRREHRLLDAHDEVSLADHGERTYQGDGRLRGFKTFITGGDSGIGRAIAIAYSREGADVAFTYMRGEEKDAGATQELIESVGRECLPIRLDLRERRNCDDAIDTIVQQWGRIDVLVNNAGYQLSEEPGIEAISDERLDRVFRTNLYPLFWLTRAAVPHMPAGSSVINTSSVQAYRPAPTMLDYAATKSAIINFTVNLAAELGPRGIRVNTVVPGPIWTPLQPASQPAELLEHLGQDTPLGRAGQPAEVAPAFVFLASPRDASYISGTVLGVTGGVPVF